MLAIVAAANIKKVQIKKDSVFIYSEGEPHAMYAIYKPTRKLCVLQYLSLLSSFLCSWQQVPYQESYSRSTIYMMILFIFDYYLI